MVARLIVTGVVLAGCFALIPLARAQVTIDASKITCDQYVHGKIGPTRSIGLWLSGFYHGKQDNKNIDVQRFNTNLNKIERFCSNEKNSNLPVMQAIEQIIGEVK